MTNLLRERNWYNRRQLTSLLEDIDKANPGCKWTKNTSSMVGGDDFSPRKWETYKVNGQPVFEVVTYGSKEEWNDVRNVDNTDAQGDGRDAGNQPVIRHLSKVIPS